MFAGRLILALTLTLAPTPAVANTGWNVFTFEWVPPCAVACSYWVDNGYEPCSNDFPPGSYQERLTEPAPEPPAGKRAVILEYQITPQVDWDAFVCSYPDRDLIGHPNLLPPEDCGPMPHPPLGCTEWVDTVVQPGARYILLAYNWSDPVDLPARYRWVFV